MKKHLTDAAIARYRAPKTGSLEIFDLGYAGLCLRVGHGGVRSFCLFHRVGGKLTRTTLGRWPRVSLADARDAWRRVAEGKAPTVEQESTGELFKDVVEQWLKLDLGPRVKASSLRVTSRIVDHDLLPVLGQKHIDQITRRDIAMLIDGIVARGAPAKARSVHAALHRLFRWSVGRGIIAVNPMASMELAGKVSSRERVLDDDELAQVWKACDGMHGEAVRLLILTASRREEIAQLRWSEIQDGAIHLSNGRCKNGQEHIIPLSAPARQLIAGIPRVAGCDLVFPANGGERAIGGWSHVKRRLDADSGVKGWVLHDLRRTAATGLQKLGIALPVVEACLNHTAGSRAGIVGIYQKHTYGPEKAGALEAWGAHVLGLVT
jgi:integrase